MPHEIPILDSMPNMKQHECDYSELEAKHRLSMVANQPSPTKDEDWDRHSLHRRLATEDYHEILVGLS